MFEGDSNGAFSERSKRRTRTASGSRKKKRRASSRAKSTKSLDSKSEKAIRNLNEEEEYNPRRGRRENRSASS